VHDSAWLKNAVLFWDQLSTIVPVGFDNPYRTRTGQALVEYGFLTPFLVSPDSHAVMSSSDLLYGFLRGQEEWMDSLARPRQRIPRRDRPMGEIGSRRQDDWDPELSTFAMLHRSKVGQVVLRLLEGESRRLGGSHDDTWIRVNPDLARFYMTILAAELAERSGVALVTPEPDIAGLADSLRLDYPASREVRSGRTSLPLRPNMFSSHGLAEASLAKCVFETIRIDEHTPIEEVIKFRDENELSIARFRAAIGRLAKDLQGEYPTNEAFEQAIRDTFTIEIRPAINELHQTRLGLQGKLAPDTLRAAVFTTAPAALAQIALGPKAMAIT
jgi:hypothetical protein